MWLLTNLNTAGMIFFVLFSTLCLEVDRHKYNAYVLCVKKSGGEEACEAARSQAQSICPDEWVRVCQVV